MAKLEEELFKTLQDLREEEFKEFKWFLNKVDNGEGLSGIAAAKLENAGRHNTVDLMVEKYQGPEGLRVLKKISRNDLMQHLQNLLLSLVNIKLW
uniref:Pyrin domain-containing protein n=1 Tax=Labrus bergylta TaxID=56723 RepID=A0A3Q3E2Z5_9LABR